MNITHRAQTSYHEYVKMDGRWFRIVWQLLPAPLENYEIIISPEHSKYLDKIAVPVEEEIKYADTNSNHS